MRAFAFVDTVDLPLVDWISWCAHPHGYVTRSTGPRKKRRELRMHRLVLGLADDDPRQADHINGMRKDNRRCNLRAVEERHNHQNLTPRKGYTSEHRGVCWDRRRQKWKAEAQVGYRRTHIGYFATETEAHEAAAEFRHLHMPFSEEAAC